MLYSSFPICQSSTRWVLITKDQNTEMRSLDMDHHLLNLLKIGKIVHQEETIHLHHQEKKNKALLVGIQDPMVKETVDISIAMDIKIMKIQMKKVDVTVDVTTEKGAITKVRLITATRANEITTKIKEDINSRNFSTLQLSLMSLCGHLLVLPHTWVSNPQSKRHAAKVGAIGVELNGASLVLLFLESSVSALALSLLRLSLICHHLLNMHGRARASTEDLKTKIKELNLS